MTVLVSGRLVSASALDNKTCPVSVRWNTLFAVPINFKRCIVTQPYGKFKKVDLYIPQGADQVFQFTDADDTADYSSISGATFDVWTSIDSGSTNTFTKTLGAGVSVVDNHKINVTITDTDSNITAQKYYFELWITTSAGLRYLLKYGDFYVQDTRKND